MRTFLILFCLAYPGEVLSNIELSWWQIIGWRYPDTMLGDYRFNLLIDLIMFSAVYGLIVFMKGRYEKLLNRV